MTGSIIYHTLVPDLRYKVDSAYLHAHEALGRAFPAYENCATFVSTLFEQMSAFMLVSRVTGACLTEAQNQDHLTSRRAPHLNSQLHTTLIPSHPEPPNEDLRDPPSSFTDFYFRNGDKFPIS